MASGSATATTCTAERRPGVRSGGYLPVQQRVIDLLGRASSDAVDGGDPPAPVDPAEVSVLRADLDGALAPLLAEVPHGSRLWLGKSPIAAVLRCPAGWRAAQQAPFRWSVHAARGTVSHKAIELSVNWRGPTEPGRAVDAAIEHLIDAGDGLGRFLAQLSTVELAELRGRAVELVTVFEECFPPLRARWRPVVEGSLRTELADGRVILSGRPDLTLGQAGRGGKVIIDLKTGNRAAHHTDDLLFYALIDTLRVGVAPRTVATMYLDSGMPVATAVTAHGLRDAADRVVRATEAMVAATHGSEPARVQSGPQCAWCPARHTCAAGRERLAYDRADGSTDH